MTITELLVSFVVSGALFFSLGYGFRLFQESQKKRKDGERKEREENIAEHERLN